MITNIAWIIITGIIIAVGYLAYNWGKVSEQLNINEEHEKELTELEALTCDRKCSKRRTPTEHARNQLLYVGSEVFKEELDNSKPDVNKEPELQAIKGIINLGDDYDDKINYCHVTIGKINYEFLVPKEIAFIRLACDEKNRVFLIYAHDCSDDNPLTMKRFDGKIYPQSISESATIPDKEIVPSLVDSLPEGSEAIQCSVDAVTTENQKAAESAKRPHYESTKQALKESIAHTSPESEHDVFSG